MQRSLSEQPAATVTAPVVFPLEPAPDVQDVFLALAGRPHAVFFDSALRNEQLGRYSFVAADPFDFVKCSTPDSDALQVLADRLGCFPVETVPDLPPFQGGAAGLLSYDLGRTFEQIDQPRFDEFGVPTLAVGLYDVVVAFDHQTDQAWIISHGFPASESVARQDRATRRAHEFRQLIQQEVSLPAHPRSSSLSDVTTDQLCPQYAVPGPSGLTSNFSADDYIAAVERAIEYIHAGDLFQVNLSQRLLFPAADDPINLYLRLRERNAATFAGYFDAGDFQICSASPERFLQVRDRHVEARPIKGTRSRTARPEADLYAGQDLKQSDKDRAENVMIVDLLRNDISRVCEPDSVHVSDLCRLETYAYVQHLVSSVRGRLRDDCSVFDLLRASFPGGSITGAPKVRAMEIIAELEPTARGPYCGSLGYLGFDGAMDTSILIRTITAGRGWWQMPVGGGIVAQSSPKDEYDETWDKAAGLIRSLEP